MNYKIIIRKRNIGTNHERYESYNNYKFVADNDARALDVVYAIQNKIEDKCKKLLPTDTCLADCLYENGRQPRHVLSGFNIDLSFKNIKQMISVVKTENQCYNKNTRSFLYSFLFIFLGMLCIPFFIFIFILFLFYFYFQNPFLIYFLSQLQNPFLFRIRLQLFITATCLIRIRFSFHSVANFSYVPPLRSFA